MVAVIRPDQNTRTARALCCRCLELHLDVTVGTKPVTKPAGKSLRFYSRIAAMRRCCMTKKAAIVRCRWAELQCDAATSSGAIP